MAGAVDDLGKDIENLKKLIDSIKTMNPTFDTRPLEDSLKRIQSDARSVGSVVGDTGAKIKNETERSSVSFGMLGEVIGRVGTAILETGVGARDMGSQFRSAFSGTGINEFAAGFDNLTAMTRGLRSSAIDVGSGFGLGFEQIRGSYQNYIASVLLAQNNTYESRQAVQEYAQQLGKLGITLDELNTIFNVSGTQQNILSEGFLLGADSGLGVNKTFGMMATAARYMGVSVEDAGKPIVALENLAKETGLPMSELANRTFGTAQEFARLGLTVDTISPIMRRFVDVLGPGFKGLAIEETSNLIRGLERQINTTQAAFIAMKGGLSRPGAGVVEAQLAFEDAFKNPVEIMKSLASTLGGVTGGKILKFEEARANPELATQFKIQRDLLAQLTGINDPQQTRTLLAILSDLQSGRQLSAGQNKTLEESLKSGTQKQEEQRSLQDKIGKAQVGLLTQIALNTSAFFDRLVPAQAQAGFARTLTESGVGIEKQGLALFNKAVEAGGKMLEGVAPGATNAVSKAYTGAIGYGEEKSGTLRPELGYSIPPVNRGEQPLLSTSAAMSGAQFLPSLASPTPTFIPTAATIAAATTQEATKTITPTGTGRSENITLTLRATDEWTRAIMSTITATINKNLHGAD